MMIDLSDSVIKPDSLRVWSESLPLRSEFRIARGAKTSAEVLMCEVRLGEIIGIGEAVPYGRYGETMDGCLQVLRALSSDLPDRIKLQSLLPAGAARNALDCALWDLALNVLGVRLDDLLPIPKEVRTAWTIIGASPKECAAAAALHADKSLLKLKMMGDGLDGQRIQAVRGSRSDARLIVDANESWNVAMYLSLLDVMVDCGVELLEQPFAVGEDGVLRDLPRPIAVCADESFSVLGGGKWEEGYDVVNIKLDKSGGLTHGLELRRRAVELGLGVMVGCMVCSGLGIGKALGLVAGADWVDLDGGLWVEVDRGVGYRGDRIYAR